jgi:hypothetical protein
MNEYVKVAAAARTPSWNPPLHYSKHNAEAVLKKRHAQRQLTTVTVTVTVTVAVVTVTVTVTVTFCDCDV